jgi:hypothetical protein
MTERVLDWRPKWDPKSFAHRLAVSPMCESLAARSSIMRKKAQWLDQGQEGACTGFGEEHVRALSPYPQPTSDQLARDVYYLAQRNDEWEGEDYSGSSVNGAMKAARLMGLIKSWKWAINTVEARHGLSYHGAGEMGAWWWTGMFDTDGLGFIHPSGSREGGHAFAVAGYGIHHGSLAYRIENSWGPSWGDNGGAWIKSEDFHTLLTDDGELAFPVKVRA